MCSILNKYLKKRFDYKTNPADIEFPHLVSAKRRSFDIYLRCSGNIVDWPEKTLVIARIYFKKQRKGYGTDLVMFLASNAAELGYKYIGIEQANEKCSAFAKKMRFLPYKNISNYNNTWLVGIDNILAIR